MRLPTTLLRSTLLGFALAGSLVTAAAASSNPSPATASKPSSSHSTSTSGHTTSSGHTTPSKGSTGNGKSKGSSGKGSTNNGHKPPVSHKPPPAPVVRIPWGWPKELSIPRLRVRATVESVSLTHPQDVHAPFKWGDVAWYNRSPRPGDMGRSEIFGHLDSTCCPAVFYLLKDLKPGDQVQVNYKSGKALTFRVLWKGVFANNRLPENFLYKPARERGLVLETCAGVFHYDGTGYDHKLLVYARMVLPNGKLG